MPEKDPLSYEAITYAWVIIISVWGGLSGYVRKIKSGYARFSLAELLGEICISGFVGVLTFFLCEAGNINQVYGAFLIGISSHMGSRAIMMLEKTIQSQFEKWINK